jgi:hypothetical protein
MSGFDELDFIADQFELVGWTFEMSLFEFGG